MPNLKFQPMRMTMKNAAWWAKVLVSPLSHQRPPEAVPLPVDRASQFTKGQYQRAPARLERQSLARKVDRSGRGPF